MIAAALALTIVVEGIIASILLGGRRLAGRNAGALAGQGPAERPAGRRPSMIPWLETIAIQLTTWPIAQWLLLRTGAFWPIELGVAIVETLLWRLVLPISFRRAAFVSLAANGVTAGIALALASA